MASAQTSKGPAPGDKNDGSDYSFRMVIDDRYKEMAKMKRNLKIASKVQTWYILVRSAWKFSPSLLYGEATKKVSLLYIQACRYADLCIK